jgi:hypothetical protein
MSRALFILVLVLGTGLVGCGDDSPAGLEVSCEMADQLGEELAPGLVFDGGGSRFRSGEPITFSFSVMNCTDSQMVISYPNAQRYEFTVEASSDQPLEVWRWSSGRRFAEGLADETFEPGETKTYTETWDQRADAGQLVPPGTYLLTSDDLHCEVPDAPSDCASGVAVVFEIK